MKNKLPYLLAILVIAFLIVKAGGDGGGGGKVGGGGNENAWVDATHSNFVTASNTPQALIQSCGILYACTTTPIAPFTPHGTNTWPVIGSNPFGGSIQYVYGCNVVDLTTGESRVFSLSNIMCGSGGDGTIQVPQNHQFKVTTSFIEHCSVCMLGLYTGIDPTLGKRIKWVGVQTYPAGSTLVGPDMVFANFEDCN